MKKNYLLRFVLLVVVAIVFGTSSLVAQTPFITVWRTSNSGITGNDQISIPATGDYSYTWEEATNPANNGSGTASGSVTITFPASGTYRVSITPTGATPFNRIEFNNGGDKLKIIRVEQWGSTAWSSMGNAFYGAENLTVTASDMPNLSGVTDMSHMFHGAVSLNNDNLSSWDVSNVTNMSYLFAGASSFSKNLATWNLSNVTDVSHMFHGATSFNNNLTAWAANLGKVTDMSYMFADATSFNANLTNWDLKTVKNMSHMFENATSFNIAIATWVLRDVTDMSYMFSGATSFNKPLNTWATMLGNVTDLSYMFAGATSFNASLAGWNPGSALNMSHMFENTTSFNQALNTWKVGSVKDMSYMFAGSAYNLILTAWDVSNVEDMSHMFEGATAFNKGLSGWGAKTSKVKNMSYMFAGATSMNSNLTGWDLSSVTDMSHMFEGATAFNIILASWNVSNVKNMAYMFAGATSFNATFFNGTSDWDVSNVVNMEGIFAGATAFNKSLELWNLKSLSGAISIANTGMSCENYSNTLHAWANNPDLPSDIVLNANGLSYSSLQTIVDDRDKLINDFGWTINGDALGACSVVLPVRLISFDVQTDNAGVRLIWSSANEENFRGYAVERSKDASGWSEIDFINAKNGSQQRADYAVVDNQPFSGNNYYRLRLVDKDGTYSYSEIKKVTYTGSASINLYPNPAKSRVSVSGLSGKSLLKLVDGNGKVLQTMNVQAPVVSINVSGLQRGVYSLVIVRDNGQVVTKRIMKE
ncbi:MAG: BspA family leucine-rich repeat surface protein [Chitinophagaceae bacterium]|nr:BspA family leucine-rich repeat surface protein [Chitinophagaceae bacterium]